MQEEIPINPSGCIRTEPVKRGVVKDKKFVHSRTTSKVEIEVVENPVRSPTHSTKLPLAAQYRQLKKSKRKLRIDRSAIHSLGVFTLEQIEKDEMIIEYVGEVIRQVCFYFSNFNVT